MTTLQPTCSASDGPPRSRSKRPHTPKHRPARRAGPFLVFNLFLEPLLRWLAQGGHGYVPSCLQHALAVLGYADDLALLCNSAAEAHHQLQKVQRFAKWAGMDLNVRKCAHTALLHEAHQARGVKRARHDLACSTLLLVADATTTTAVTWHGLPLPYLPPDKTYEYLGVHTAQPRQNASWGVGIEGILHQSRAPK